MMKLTVLGTSCMVPTKDRNVSGYYLDVQGEGVLLDCGEGTQRQMNIAGINRHNVKKILITHWHGDHVSGLLGLIQTLGNKEYTSKLQIFGPEGSTVKMNHVLNSCSFDQRIEIEVIEVKVKKLTKFFETEVYELLAAPLHHSIPCIGYSIVEKDRRRIHMAKLESLGVQEGKHLQVLQNGEDMKYKGKVYEASKFTYIVKGKKLSYIPDTTFCSECFEIAENADLLICESTFDHSLKEKALQKKHITSREAAQIAAQSNVKRLLLTHFSQRYKDLQPVLDDAKDVFENVECAFDFMKVKL